MKWTVSDGWFYLGPAVTNSSAKPGAGVIVKELEQGILVDVKDWEQVWNDNGSSNNEDYSLWRGVPPDPKYVVVGGSFVCSFTKPSAEVQSAKAVLREVLATATHGEEIWTDDGSGAERDGALWSIATIGDTSLATGAFVPVEGYGNPPSEVFALDRSYITES